MGIAGYIMVHSVMLSILWTKKGFRLILCCGDQQMMRGEIWDNCHGIVLLSQSMLISIMCSYQLAFIRIHKYMPMALFDQILDTLQIIQTNCMDRIWAR